MAFILPAISVALPFQTFSFGVGVAAAVLERRGRAPLLRIGSLSGFQFLCFANTKSIMWSVLLERANARIKTFLFRQLVSLPLTRNPREFTLCAYLHYHETSPPNKFYLCSLQSRSQLSWLLSISPSYFHSPAVPKAIYNATQLVHFIEYVVLSPPTGRVPTSEW